MAESAEEEGQVELDAGALEMLAAGNTRFLDAIAQAPDPEAVTACLAVANPYAIVLGCSDSRVPPEVVFDESVGRLFVVRVAAHLAGNAEIGSIEFALGRWACPVVVVLGHTQCGGVAAAMDRQPPGADPPPSEPGAASLPSLVAAIHANLGWTPAAPADPWLEAVRRNVRQTVQQLPMRSMLIRKRVEAGQLRVAGAIYRVETGEVEFLDV